MSYNVYENSNLFNDETINNFFKDKYITTSIIVILVLYIVFVAPKLNKDTSEMFDSSIFKLFILFFIGYVSTKNLTIALIIGISYFITLQTANRHRVNDKVLGIILVENTNNAKEKQIKPSIDMNAGVSSLHPMQPQIEIQQSSPVAEVKPVIVTNQEKRVKFSDESLKEPFEDIIKMHPSLIGPMIGVASRDTKRSEREGSSKKNVDEIIDGFDSTFDIYETVQ